MGGLGKCPCCKEHKQLTEHHDKEIREKVMICRACHDILEEYIKIQTEYRARFGASGEETEDYFRLDEYDEEDYLDGKYNTGTASKETRKLYFEIKRRILENFEDLEPRQKKVYTGFYSKTNGACIV